MLFVHQWRVHISFTPQWWMVDNFHRTILFLEVTFLSRVLTSVVATMPDYNQKVNYLTVSRLHNIMCRQELSTTNIATRFGDCFDGKEFRFIVHTG